MRSPDPAYSTKPPGDRTGRPYKTCRSTGLFSKSDPTTPQSAPPTAPLAQGSHSVGACRNWRGGDAMAQPGGGMGSSRPTAFPAARGGRMRGAAKPPLCKGRWHGVSRDGGVAGLWVCTAPISPHNPVGATLAVARFRVLIPAAGRPQGSPLQVLAAQPTFCKIRLYNPSVGSADSSPCTGELFGRRVPELARGRRDGAARRRDGVIPPYGARPAGAGRGSARGKNPPAIGRGIAFHSFNTRRVFSGRGCLDQRSRRRRTCP